ncbi:MAG: hypothetical protein ACI358_06620 [Candidatus Limimorpha sp.]
MKKFCRILSYIILIYSFIGTTICIFNIFPRSDNQEFDYSGIIVGILSLLVTLLVGWNIWTAIDLKNEMKNANKQIDDFYSNIQKKQKELDYKITELNRKQETIKNFGYAITDFCQVYTKLEPPKKDYFETYCKSLSSLRNFIKTDENLNWYANACISNMSEALRLAKEKNEQCDADITKNIENYIDEVRKCQLDGFRKYWNKITELENERKEYERRETNSEQS